MGSPGMPVEGQQVFLWARVQNRTEAEIANATVNFYWTPSGIGITGKAIKHGSASVTIPGGASSDVLCLRPWSVPYKACLVVEAFHASLDPVNPALRARPTADPHLAQRNLTILHVRENSLPIGGEFFTILPLMVNNSGREEQVFTVTAEPASLRALDPLVETGGLDGALLGDGGEARIAGFTGTAYPGPAELDQASPEVGELKIPPGGHVNLHLIARLDGDAGLVEVLQFAGGVQVGGMGFLLVRGE
ncbi:hypothetical protein [Streptomyces phytophilus]|uniref:hypothetical protein n=1 Tax=Streptomyces phytophilus TaxID=722715 RepID=UPI0015F07D36|nr:hypothetical protein [Streptomyces phytophilus]